MVASRPADSGTLWPMLLGVVLLLASVAGLAWWRRLPDSPSSTSPRTIERAVKPPPAREGYVGSQACAKCHAEIAASYAQHPMARSCGVTPGPDDIEAFDRGEFDAGHRLQYRVERRDDAVYHHELRRDTDGQSIYDQEALIAYYVGSGARGKSYLIDRGGLLYQSPISWYSNKGIWDLSPGYHAPSHNRFERRVLSDCMWCHAGRVLPEEGHDHAFVEPVVVEGGIGCERCHGPGQEHVAHQQSGRPRADDRSMTNPARLSFDRRDAVCNQCHLQGKERIPRYGRQFEDFRPGDRIDEVWLVMVASTGVRDDGRTKAVSQVEQMYDSRCFQASAGRLGCISCHDPHAAPPRGDAAASYYRQRCAACHDEHGCALPIEQRSEEPANNSCVYCHMPRLSAHDIPHASQTDHRIVRRKTELTSGPDEAPATPDELTVFDDGQGAVPDWELERVRALVRIHHYERSNLAPEKEVRLLEQSLRAIVEIAPDDRPSWFALGVAAAMLHNPTETRKAWERVLQISPKDERALEALAGLCQSTGDYDAGLRYIDRLLSINPWHARNQMRRAMLLLSSGDALGAAAAAETALELNPTDNAARRWLIAVYEQVGSGAAARRHADTLQRLSQAGNP